MKLRGTRDSRIKPTRWAFMLSGLLTLIGAIPAELAAGETSEAAILPPWWDWDIYTKRSGNGGATWGPHLRMSDTPTHARHPQITATPGGVVCCIWEDGQVFDGTHWGGDPALYASVSTNNGMTWEKPRRITSVNAPHGWATHAKSCAFGCRIHLAWTDAPEGPAGPRAAYYMTSRDGGLTWENSERIAVRDDGELWAAAVAGTDSYAIELVSRSDALFYSRRSDVGSPSARQNSRRHR